MPRNSSTIREGEKEEESGGERENEAPLAQTLVKNTLILNEYFTAFKLTE